ncbi:MAG: hypothetical protein PHD97_12060 [Bacteroidales bacterium]|nr:hypothetical protein [Bacteroidales bacterium]
MKIRIIFLVQILFFLFYSFTNAQTNTATITAIHQNDSIIEITITTPTHFHQGANPYVLYIGDKYFSMSKEPKNGEGRNLVFFVPLSEYNELADGSTATLVYGFYNENAPSGNGDNVSREFIGPHWQLGKLNKTILNK